MPESFTISVFTRAPRAVVWSVFSDIGSWRAVGAEMHGEVHWRSGEPWARGSTFVAELLHPVQASVTHRILSCVPAERVNWSAHAIRVTIERLIEFKDAANGTEIKTSAILVGNPARNLGGDLGDLLNQFTSRWYQQLARACDAQVG